MFIRENMRAVNDLDIPDGDKRLIFSENATAMFRL